MDERERIIYSVRPRTETSNQVVMSVPTALESPVTTFPRTSADARARLGAAFDRLMLPAVLHQGSLPRSRYKGERSNQTGEVVGSIPKAHSWLASRNSLGAL